MSFWTSELGEISGKAEDAFAKSFKQIPDNTMALAKISKFVNVEFNGFKYLAIEWLLIDGDFKGQKVQQKLKVFGGDQYDRDPAKTKHRALNMFKLLYQTFDIKPKHADAPSDQDLLVFVDKIAGIKIRETEPNDQNKQYNWVSEVHQAQGFKCETGVSVAVNTIESAFSRNPAPVTDALMDIPF